MGKGYAEAKAAYKQAKHKANWQMVKWLSKPSPPEGYTPVVDWQAYDTTMGVDYGQAGQEDAYWAALPVIETLNQSTTAFDVETTVPEPKPTSADSLKLINAFTQQWQSGWAMQSHSKPMPKAAQYTTTHGTVFPVEGSYTVLIKGVPQQLAVSITDDAAQGCVVATVRLPVGAILQLNAIDVWFKQAITAGAQAATASLTTLDAFTRLLDQPAYRDFLKAYMKAYLQSHPQAALELGIQQGLAAAPTLRPEDL